MIAIAKFVIIESEQEIPVRLAVFFQRKIIVGTGEDIGFRQALVVVEFAVQHQTVRRGQLQPDVASQRPVVATASLREWTDVRTPSMIANIAIIAAQPDRRGQGGVKDCVEPGADALLVAEIFIQYRNAQTGFDKIAVIEAEASF